MENKAYTFNSLFFNQREADILKHQLMTICRLFILCTFMEIQFRGWCLL